MTTFALRVAAAAVLLCALAPTVTAAPIRDARFMSLRTDEANGRRGPASDQPILWIYKARGLPMQVLAESGEYFQVRDPEGESVWIHKSQLSARRTVWVLPADKPLALMRGPESRGRPVAILEPRVLATLEACEGGWRKVSAGGHSGWAPAEGLFGGASCVGVEP
ncbi:MAG: hypothetical protein KJS97_15155 [Alphaproteobacteria bacterium]|nr:hypothetical protein [Alphaproteobacteria bacterium]